MGLVYKRKLDGIGSRTGRVSVNFLPFMAVRPDQRECLAHPPFKSNNAGNVPPRTKRTASAQVTVPDTTAPTKPATRAEYRRSTLSRN